MQHCCRAARQSLTKLNRGQFTREGAVWDRSVKRWPQIVWNGRKMRRAVTVCLLVVVCLLLEARGGGHHDHRKRGRKHHGHHHGHSEDTEHRDNKLALSSDKLKIHTVKIGWLNVPKVVGCRCRHQGAICIKGPDGKPTCVQKHHLKESARLFKHYHELKEKAEEDLNEVDPPLHTLLHHAPPAAPHDAPHDVHIAVARGQHSDVSVSEEQRHLPGFQPKPRKGHVKLHQTAQRVKDYLTHNSALLPTTKPRCDNASLDEMRRRLTGWFHLLHHKDHRQHHNDHQHRRSHRHLSVKKELREGGAEGQCQCLRSVLWEFHQMDTDHSHKLTKAEVKVIDNNDLEPCLHPYLLTCDGNGDGLLSQREWCCCFPNKESESPCYARLDEIETTKNTEAYIPSCDREGYYHKEQCMGGPSAQTCWCVTPTGSEIPGSRSVGRAHCSKLDYTGHRLTKS